MKKVLATSIIAILFFACNQPQEENATINNESKIEIADSTILKTENLEVETAEERTLAFFNWYELNSNDWFGKSNAVVGTKDNFYYLDTAHLNTYMSWLNESNYFSKSYLKFEEERWKGDCNAEMLAFKKEGFKADGLPPCIYEADILFLNPDVIIKEVISNISISTDTITDSYAVIDYGISKLYWIKENGNWKISDIHYPKQ